MPPAVATVVPTLVAVGSPRWWPLVAVVVVVQRLPNPPVPMANVAHQRRTILRQLRTPSLITPSPFPHHPLIIRCPAPPCLAPPQLNAPAVKSPYVTTLSPGNPTNYEFSGSVNIDPDSDAQLVIIRHGTLRQPLVVAKSGVFERSSF